MKKLFVGVIAALSVVFTAVVPAQAADLPTFTASDLTVTPGQTVTITVTPGTGDAVYPSGPDYMVDICAGYWAGDNPTMSTPHFSLAGSFSKTSGSYTAKSYPSTADGNADGHGHVKWSSAGWGDFTPNTQTTPFTFDFTIPDDIVDGGAYQLAFSCMSPEHWLRDRATLVQYNIEFTVATVPNQTVAFNANGGSGTMASQVTNASTALTANAFTRDGYTFKNWNTSANGRGTSYADLANFDFSVAGATLYAQWTKNGSGSSNPGTSGSTGNLASTGSDSTFTGGLSVALLVLGFVLVSLRRKNTRRVTVQAKHRG